MATRNDTSTKKNKRLFGFKGLVNKRKSKNKKIQSQYSITEDDSTPSCAITVGSTVGSSVMSSSAKTPVGEPVQVIVLLMDPQTRRFELLQLEFNSATVKVSDVIDQIVISATDPSLRIQTYETLTDLQGIELVPSKLIAEYIDSAGVVLAVPSSCTDKGEAVVKQANTILTDPKFHTMVSSKTDALLCLVTYILN
jgi:hypothetical protein